ncbi:MAG: DUF4147 domain-containing protein [Thermomicrobiales bacterium]
MTRSLRDDVEQIYRAALKPVGAGDAVSAQLGVTDAGELLVGDWRVDPGQSGVFAIAIGKAAVGMIDAAAQQLGGLFESGIAVTKAEAPSSDGRVSVMYGSHPTPDERSLEAGNAVMRFAADVPDGAVVLCLISGGGSALVESLREGIDLGRLRELTTGLLRAGASIHELNAVRSRLSRIKAGGLLQALGHARVFNLIVSDVQGDDLQTIASGPTVPAVDGDAGAVMRTYSMAGTIPQNQPRGGLPMPPTIVVANLSTAIEAAAVEAAEIGYAPVIITRTLDIEAREAGKMLAAMVADGAAGLTTHGRGTCLLAGGETTVTVRGDGVGGRNTEAALSAAIRLSGAQGAALGFLATDGDDGATGAAGGIVDGATVDAANRSEALRALAENDSFTFLRKRGAALITGPSGTNVNDLVVGLIG